MTFNSDIHHRRSIRLKGYDYLQAGAYFVTICTQNRECLFGGITDGQMALNNAGRMVQMVWDKIPEHYAGIKTDAFVVMPNHIHGIIVLVGAGPRACPDTKPTGVGQSQKGQPRGVAPTGMEQSRFTGQPRGVAPTLSLPDVVHRFKTMTTKRYADGVKQDGWASFPGKLWQRNYYERIIRDEDELNRIREYILNNPRQWEFDRENPVVSKMETTAADGKNYETKHCNLDAIEKDDE